MSELLAKLPTLESALKFNKEQLTELKNEIFKRAKNSEINAYVKSDENFGGDFEMAQNAEFADFVPIALKDNINVKGWEITCGSRILQGYIAPYNASVVEKMLQNKLVPFGRANMDEFAMGSTTATSFWGKTKNPRDISRVPGGSSGGSAAAVAGRLAIAALGSDTGGSIRQPAAFCGCVGLKPTYGRVSRYGLVAYSSSLDQIGPLTQNVRDSAILFDMISGYDKLDSTSAQMPASSTFSALNEKQKFTIAILPELLKDADSSVQNAYQNTIDALSKLGHKIIEKKMLDTKFMVAVYYVLSTAEASSNLARFDGVRYGRRADDLKNLKDLYIKTRTEGFGEEVKRRILLGSFVLSSGYYDAYYIKAQKTRSLIAKQYAEILGEADLILSPATPSVAFDFNTPKTPLQMYLEDIYTIGINLAGLPGISLPVGVCAETKMPLGMQIIGRAFEEQKILDCALGLETTLGVEF